MVTMPCDPPAAVLQSRRWGAVLAGARRSRPRRWVDVTCGERDGGRGDGRRRRAGTRSCKQEASGEEGATGLQEDGIRRKLLRIQSNGCALLYRTAGGRPAKTFGPVRRRLVLALHITAHTTTGYANDQTHSHRVWHRACVPSIYASRFVRAQAVPLSTRRHKSPDISPSVSASPRGTVLHHSTCATPLHQLILCEVVLLPNHNNH